MRYIERQDIALVAVAHGRGTLVLAQVDLGVPSEDLHLLHTRRAKYRVQFLRQLVALLGKRVTFFVIRIGNDFGEQCPQHIAPQSPLIGVLRQIESSQRVKEAQDVQVGSVAERP